MNANTTINPYIPILRWRPAEMAALEKLFPNDRKNVTPLIEFIMPAPSMDKKSRKVTKTPREKFLAALPDVSKELLASWGKDPVFIDVHLLDGDIRASTLAHVLSSSSELDLFSIPVTYVIPVTSTDADIKTRAIAIEYAKTSGRGLCIRIDRSHFDDENLASHILNFINVNGLEIKNTDLLLDLRVIERGVDAEDIVKQLVRLPELEKWRSFIVSGGVFPKDLTEFHADEVHKLERSDWQLWKKLQSTDLPRKPFFSDYTIQHPFYEYVAAIGSASVRYTDDENWWIFRGRKPGYINPKTKEKGPGREQYIDHARTLMKRDFYKKRDYSFGDGDIARIAADGNTKPGGPGTWLVIGINHHVTLAARQISSLYGIPEVHS